MDTVKKPLSGPQSEVVRIIAAATFAGRPISMREMNGEIGVTFHSVYRRLRLAEQKGALTHDTHKARTYRCTLPILTSREGVRGFLEWFQMSVG